MLIIYSVNHMKLNIYIILNLILLFLAVNIRGQQIVDDNFLLSPLNGIITTSAETGKRHKVSVCPNIVGRYPESNYQYVAYLDWIELSGDTLSYYKAIPNTEYLKSIGLDTDEILFFQQEYLFSNIYMDYPIVGFTYDQLDDYFKWKKSELGFAYLEFKGLYKRIVGSAQSFLSYIDSAETVSPVLVDYRIPTQAEMISGIKSGYTGSTSRKGEVDKSLIKWIRKNNIYEHLTIKKLNGNEIHNDILNRYDLKPSKYYDLKKVKKIFRSQSRINFIVMDLGEPPSLKDESVGKRVYITEVKGLLSASIDYAGRIKLESGWKMIAPVRSVSIYFGGDCKIRGGLNFSNIK